MFFFLVYYLYSIYPNNIIAHDIKLWRNVAFTCVLNNLLKCLFYIHDIFYCCFACCILVYSYLWIRILVYRIGLMVQCFATNFKFRFFVALFKKKLYSYCIWDVTIINMLASNPMYITKSNCFSLPRHQSPTKSHKNTQWNTSKWRLLMCCTSISAEEDYDPDLFDRARADCCILRQ